LRKERLQKQTQFEQLLVNVSDMQGELATLRTELSQLQTLRGSGAAAEDDHNKKGKVIE
jgi:hypothetical protein